MPTATTVFGVWMVSGKARTKKPSVDEILAVDPKNARDAVHAMWERMSGRDEDDLTDSEALVKLVVDFEMELQDGGFSQFFHHQGYNAKELATALSEIAAHNVLSMLKKAMSVFPQGDVPRDEDEVERLLEQVDGEDEMWEELDQDYQEMHDQELGQCLLTFMLDNRADFS